MDPKTIDEFLDEVSTTESLFEKISELKDYANRLEVEIRNMSKLKYSLPISMDILANALSTIKEKLGRLRRGPGGGDALFPTIVGGGLVVPSRTGRGEGLQISESNGSGVPTVYANVEREGLVVPSGTGRGLQISESSGSGAPKSKKPKLVA